jgi:hypothetical protein
MLNPFTTLVDPRGWINLYHDVMRAMPWLVPVYGLIYGAMAPLVATATNPRIGVVHTLLAVDYTLVVYAISRLVKGRAPVDIR